MLKRKVTLIILLIFFLSLLVTTPVSAANGIFVFINGSEYHFSPSPVIKSGTALVPMRPFFEALGAEVQWNNTSKIVIGKRGNITVSLSIGSTTADVNGQKRVLSVPAQLINGNTYIPLRFVGEALGDNVVYDSASRTIKITSKTVTVSPELKVHFIDVGQADSIYIQAPDHYDILIDGGNNADGPSLVQYLKNQGVDDIELMIATHPHEDHIGGLNNVLSAFKVDQIIDSGIPAASEIYTDYISVVQAEKAKYLSDDDVTFNIGKNITFSILDSGDNYEDVNDDSVITLLDYNNIEFLFAGDMEAEEEADLLSMKNNIDIDILKVGHHGSSSSTTDAFLKATTPEVAVISVGAGNTYRHPSASTLSKLEEYKAKIYRTDVNGNIVVSTNGNTYSVMTERQGNTMTGGTVVTPKPITKGKYVGSRQSNKYHLPTCMQICKSDFTCQPDMVYV